MLGLRDRGRCLAAKTVEIGDCVGGFRRRIGTKLVADGAGETFLARTATAAATTATTPATAIGAALLLATGCLFLAFLAFRFGLGILFAFAGRHGRLGNSGRAILARLLVPRTTATAAATATLAALAVLLGSGVACGLLLDETFGLLGLDLGFALRIELLVVIGLFDQGGGLAAAWAASRALAASSVCTCSPRSMT